MSKIYLLKMKYIIKNIITFANKVGAITYTNYGSIASMPTLEEVTNIK